MSKRASEQPAGLQSGLSEKKPVGNYLPATNNEKNGIPRSAPTESAPRGHKIK